MQQRIYCLRMEDVVAGIEMMREVFLAEPVITYCAAKEIQDARVPTLSDPVHGGSYCNYGQTGGLSGIYW